MLLKPFSSIRTLITTNSVLSSTVLEWLGTLPHLESIDVRPSMRWLQNDESVRLSLDDLAIPEGSFPALRHLALHCVPSWVVPKLWSTPALVQRLMSVEVEFRWEDLQTSVSELARVICENSPRLVEINFNVPEFANDRMLSPDVLNCLRRLPLQRVKMTHATLKAANYEALILALPEVEYLDISSINLGFQQLVLIAEHMPKLRYLEADIVVAEWPLQPTAHLFKPTEKFGDTSRQWL
ncbi:hypothetical protein FRC07_006988, partial [Ceratobasidium sp. 392]